MGESVEGADPQCAARHAEQLLDPPAHLAGGLVGEGDRQNGVRRNTVVRDQPGDAVYEDACLTAAGAGEDEGGARRGGDGITLRVVHFGEEGFGVHGRHSIGLRHPRPERRASGRSLIDESP